MESFKDKLKIGTKVSYCIITLNDKGERVRKIEEGVIKKILKKTAHVACEEGDETSVIAYRYYKFPFNELLIVE